MPKLLQKKTRIDIGLHPDKPYISMMELALGDELTIRDGEFLVLWIHNGILSLELNHGKEAIFIAGNDVLVLNEARHIKIGHLYDYSVVIALIINKAELEAAAGISNFVISAALNLSQRLAVLQQKSSLYHYPDTMRLLYCVDLVIKDMLESSMPGDNGLILTDTLRLLEQIGRVGESRELVISYASNVLVAAQVMEYIRHNYTTAALSEIARQLHYHPNYLSSLLVKSCGMTFKEMLNTRRLLVGRTLLLTTEHSLNEISSMLGFKSYSGFYRAFMRKYQVSPDEYRKIRQRTESLYAGFEISVQNM